MSVKEFWNELNSRVRVMFDNANITERELQVLGYRFGLYVIPGVDGQPDLETVAKKLGVTRERVRQIETRAMRKIAETGPDFDMIYGYTHFTQLSCLLAFMQRMNDKKKYFEEVNTQRENPVVKS